MRLLWIFTLFWCAISFTMVGVVWQSSAPPAVLGFMSLYAVIGLGLLVFLIKSHYDRWRVGAARLIVNPSSVEVGESLTLCLQMENDNFSGQSVKFELLGQQDDDGWTTQQTITQTATIQPVLRQAMVRLTVPDNATESSATWRWRATAVVAKYPRAKVECDVSVTQKTARHASKSVTGSVV